MPFTEDLKILFTQQPQPMIAIRGREPTLLGPGCVPGGAVGESELPWGRRILWLRRPA